MAQIQRLFTGFNGGTGVSANIGGNGFSVENLTTSPITIFRIIGFAWTNNISAAFQVYTREGGAAQTSAGWQLVFDGDVGASGPISGIPRDTAGQPTIGIPKRSNAITFYFEQGIERNDPEDLIAQDSFAAPFSITIAPGEKIGIFVNPGEGVRYTSGDIEPFSNEHLGLSDGFAGNSVNGTYFSPRYFNGALYYVLGTADDVPVPAFPPGDGEVQTKVIGGSFNAGFN